MLSVSVQGEVDITTVALNDHRVPVIVIQQAAGGHRGVTHDRAVLIAACNCKAGKKEENTHEVEYFAEPKIKK